MSLSLIRCDRCGALVEFAAWNTGVFTPCACGAKLYARAYPKLVTPLAAGHGGADRADDDQSCCFYHPQKQAAVACETCGRFLCDLCDLAIGEVHVCGQCYWRAMQESNDERFCPRRPTHDQAALMLAIIPVTAPLGVYYALRHWNSPGSVLGVRRGWLTAAAVVGAVGTVFWGYVAVKLISEVFFG